MPDIESKLNNIKMIQKGKIPKEYRHAGGVRKYQTESEKYNAVYKEIDECSEQELNILEVLLKNQIEKGKSLNNFMGVLSLAGAFFTAIFAISPQLLNIILSILFKQMEASKDENIFSDVNIFSDINTFLDKYIKLLCGMMMLTTIFIIIIYYRIHLRGSREIQQGQYLLYILQSVKKKRGMV